MDTRRIFGNWAESQSEKFLKKQGLTILDRQFRSRYGEIDLVAREGDEIVFVEVKARKTMEFGYPEESVTSKKLEKIWKTGEVYLEEKGMNLPIRIDVVAVLMQKGKTEIQWMKAVE